MRLIGRARPDMGATDPLHGLNGAEEHYGQADGHSGPSSLAEGLESDDQPDGRKTPPTPRSGPGNGTTLSSSSIRASSGSAPSTLVLVFGYVPGSSGFGRGWRQDLVRIRLSMPRTECHSD